LTNTAASAIQDQLPAASGVGWAERSILLKKGEENGI
jgi:hypothetical protein